MLNTHDAGFDPLQAQISHLAAISKESWSSKPEAAGLISADMMFVTVIKNHQPRGNICPECYPDVFLELHLDCWRIIRFFLSCNKKHKSNLGSQ